MQISVKRLFDGRQWHHNVALCIDDENFNVLDINEALFDKQRAIPYLIPALVDLQIYGAGGRLLSEYPDGGTLEAISSYCQSSGCVYFQPTIASQSKEVIFSSIDAVRSFKNDNHQQCIGLHLEGPWINAERRGAHSLDYVRSPTFDEVKEILDYGKDVITMITVAPEVCDSEILQYISDQRVILSAGHTNACYEQAVESFKSITVATHLYNAMSPLQHRAPGMVGAILNHPTVMSSIVVDGYHVDYNAVQIAKKMMGERLFCITDAVTETSSGPYQHYLEADRYLNRGILSGSALTQLKSITNLVNHVGIELGEAIRMCSVYPARVMRYHPEITGMIQIGHKSPFICLDENLQLIHPFE